MGKVNAAFNVYLAVFVLLVGLVCLLISSVGFDQARHFLDGLSPDGDAEQFTPETFASGVSLLRLFGSLGVLSAFGLFWLRHQVDFPSYLNLGPLALRVVHILKRLPAYLWLFLLVAVALGVWLRWADITQPMRSDESWTYLNYVTRNWLVILTTYDSPNNHILHNLFAHLSIYLFGDGLAAFRFPALVAGCLSIVFGFWAGRRFYGTEVGVGFALLIAVWPMLVDYSVNARGYSMVVCLTLLLFVVGDAFRNGAKGSVFWFALICALGMLVIPSFALSILVVGGWILCSYGGAAWMTLIGRLLVSGCLAVMMTLALYGPVLAFNGLQALIANDVVVGDGVQTASAFAHMLSLWTDWTQGVPHYVQILAAFGGLAALVLDTRKTLALLVPLIGVGVFVSLLQGTLGPGRVWVFAVPVVLVVALGGLHELGKLLFSITKLRGVATAAVVVLPLTLVMQILVWPAQSVYREFGYFPQGERVYQHLLEAIDENEALILAFPATKTVAYYADRAGDVAWMTDVLMTNKRKPQAIYVVVPADNTLERVVTIFDELNNTRVLTTFAPVTSSAIQDVQVARMQPVSQ